MIAQRVGLATTREGRAFPGRGDRPRHPFSGEKLSLVLALYRARLRPCQGPLPSAARLPGTRPLVGIHTCRPERARALAAELDVVRVLVNQAHTFGNGGGFDNGLPFTLSMGCGTWAGATRSPRT